MLWLIVTISFYLILSVVFLVDKHLLVGPIPSPKIYAFFVGMLGLLFLVLVPFVDFEIPEGRQIILSFLAGASYIYAIFWFYKALRLYEASRIVPSIGGILPIFTFSLVYIFSGGKEIFGLWEFLSFIFLILGSVLITYKRHTKFSFKSLQISAIAAFFLSLSFVLTKYVFLAQPFWSGFILIKVGWGLMALMFLFSLEVRRGLFKVKSGFSGKTAVIFLSNQAAGATANILQNWAIALAPLVYIAVINAIQGIQYVFLLIFAVLLSIKFPKVLKEEISRDVILQKIIAILFIGIGLTILALK